ncbi:MAG: hypothetical protein K1W39_07495 [Lachnospiraceae bacterium]
MLSFLFNQIKKRVDKKTSRLPDTEHGHEPVSGHECKAKEAAGMGLEDMVHLVYIMDAYRQLNITCCGEEIMMGFDEGCIGALSRIYRVIEHNACADMRKKDFKKGDKILLDTSLTAEERAKKLLGK